MADEKVKLGFTFGRFLVSKTIASISFTLFLIFLMWRMVVVYQSIFLAGMVPVIYLVVMLASALPIGHAIDRVNNSVLSALSAFIITSGFVVFALGFTLFTVYLSIALVATGYTLSGDSFFGLLKKVVSNDAVTKATAYNYVSNSVSSLVGVAMGGISLLFLENYADLILLGLSITATILAYPVKMKLNGYHEVEEQKERRGEYREVLSFYRSIIGFTVFALVINGFFVSIDVYGSGLFNLYLHTSPVFYTLFEGAFPAGMMIGSFLANRYEKSVDNPRTIGLLVLVYSPILIALGLSRIPALDVLTAGMLGFVNPFINVPLVARLTRFTPVSIFGRVMAFLRIFIQSATPVTAAIFSFATLFFSVPLILLSVGLVMIPFSVFGFGVARTFYVRTSPAT